MKKIILAPDSFKGTMSSSRVCRPLVTDLGTILSTKIIRVYWMYYSTLKEPAVLDSSVSETILPLNTPPV
jgi:hypothetical protein